MATFIFPGQGSQIKGMGGTLFSEFPDMANKADIVQNRKDSNRE